MSGWIELLDIAKFDLNRIGSFDRGKSTQKLVSKLAIDIHKTKLKLQNGGLTNLGNADGSTPTFNDDRDDEGE